MDIKERIQRISFINEPYIKWKWRERKVRWGNEHQDKTFLVVRRASCKVGLFSHVMTNMGLVAYALDKGYIPVIDMQNNANNYLEKDKIGKENAWEYFFQQPCGFSLEDIAKAKNVILSNGLITKDFKYPDFTIVEDGESFHYWHFIFQNYLKLSDDMTEEAEKAKRVFFNGEKTLGILARGTDYVTSKPKGHPIQPTVEQIIEKAEEVMDERNCKRIFLATEDADIYRKLKDVFGVKLAALETERYRTKNNENINDLITKNDMGKVQKGREYLLSILMLTNCECIVAGNVGGTHGVLLMGKEYEYKCIFNLGMYA